MSFVRARNLSDSASFHPDPFNVTKVDTVTLSAAQIIAMGTTAVSIVASPAANEYITVDKITFQFKPGTTQFTGGGALTFEYHGGTVDVVTGTILAAVVTSASASTTTLGPVAGTNGLTVTTGAGVDLKAASAFAAGNGTAIVTVYYSVTTLQ